MTTEDPTDGTSADDSAEAAAPDADVGPQPSQDTDGEPRPSQGTDGRTQPSQDADNEPQSSHQEAELATPARRRALGPWLLGGGASAWAIVALMRCGGPAAPMTVPTEPEPRPTAQAEQPDPVPTPPAATPEPEPPGPDPYPQPAAWARDAKPPQDVRYTIRRGGSLKNVANLFKIFHHEIVALNPGVRLESDLPPDTSVVVYRRNPAEPSASLGLPSKGSLEGGVPMVDGPGRELKAIPWKAWGTASTIATLDRALRRWAERGPGGQPILVGNISSRTGGRLPPHSTHQSGRDVDLGYLQKLPEGEELNWREMTAANLDAAETWALLRILADTGAVEVVYIDRSIQKLLHAHALQHGLMSERALARWMEYPRPNGTGDPMVQHVPGHVDHIHVRFACAEGDTRCKTRGR